MNVIVVHIELPNITRLVERNHYIRTSLTNCSDSVIEVSFLTYYSNSNALHLQILCFSLTLGILQFMLKFIIMFLTLELQNLCSRIEF